MDVQERIQAAMVGSTKKQPDRVPIYIPGHDVKFLEIFDKKYGDEIGDNTCICNGMDMTPLATLGVDCCDVPGPRHLNPERELPTLGDESLIIDLFGRIFKVNVVKNIEYHIYQGPYLTSEQKIKEWDYIEPQQIEPDWFDRIYDEAINCVEKHQICPIFTGCDGLYSVLEGAIGVENMAYMLHDYPEFIEFQLEKVFKVIYSDVKGILDAGGAFILIKDDIAPAHRPIITPDQVEDHLLKYYKKLVSLIHEKGGKAFFRTTGDVIGVLDTIIKAGFEVIHLTNPEVSYMDEMKTFWGEQICIMGNVDVISILSYGTQVQVRKNVNELMGIAKEGGNFIFGTNNSLPGTVKMQNLEEMIAIAKIEGKY
ncbi:MAG: uroporphyrinogen decarboxylase family protein, partial [Candidatus Hodarchaeota archaeon]